MRKIKLLFTILLFSLFAAMAQAQKLEIKGNLYDSTSHIPVGNATALLLQAKDSIIVAHTRSTNNGDFNFANLNPGKYVLTFLYPEYVDLSKEVDLSQSQNIGNINLFRKEFLLKEVVVKGRRPITIKGDTTEYDAGSFKVQANANVEDLLKQLPSIQVDQNGNITAQGQKVKHVYVDGEEFFGDDPTLVTKNLRADIIDKVQVYDKKSDASAFTGVDDGSREKTVNLVVKQDKKNGYFGRINAGYGTDNFYNFQGMFNQFKGSRKISAFLTQSNTGVSGLSSDDQAKIGTSNGNYSNGNYNGKGLPNITNGGLHYDNKWNDDKTEFNGNYTLNNTLIKGNDNTVSQNNLVGQAQIQTSNSYFDNRSLSNAVNARFTQKLDSTSKIIIYADGNASKSNNFTSGFNNLQQEDGSLLYQQTTSNRQKTDNISGNLNLDYMKSFKKKGRSIALYIHQNSSENKGDGLSLSTTNFFNNPSNPNDTQLLNLQKTQNSSNSQTTFNTYYTEPLNDKWNMALSYQLNNNDNKDAMLSYNQDAQGNANTLDNRYSSYFHTQQLKNQGGLSFLYNYKKLNFNFGTNVADVNFSMDNLLQNNSQLNRNFTTYNPIANLRYDIGSTKSLGFNYTGNTILPSNTQLQPFLYNNSQVLTFNPNTALQSSYSNAISMNYYNTYNMLRSGYYGGGIKADMTNNPITLALNNDASGFYNYQYQNLKNYNNQSLTIDFYTGYKFKNLGDIMLRGYMAAVFGKTYNIINNQINQFDANFYDFETAISKEIPDKISFFLANNLGYNTNVASLQKSLSNQYLSSSSTLSSTLYFLKSFEINSSVVYVWQEKSSLLPRDFSQVIWNAYVGKSFGKKKELLMKLSAHDLLNQNKGFTTSASSGNITQNTYTTIQRYFMFSLVWNFNNFAGVKQ